MDHDRVPRAEDRKTDQICVVDELTANSESGLILPVVRRPLFDHSICGFRGRRFSHSTTTIAAGDWVKQGEVNIKPQNVVGEATFWSAPNQTRTERERRHRKEVHRAMASRQGSAH
jgi:hypothetical protein